MTLNETVEVTDKLLLIKHKSNNDIKILDTKRYDCAETYHYEKIKEFVYSSTDISDDISVDEINQKYMNNLVVETIRKNFLLELHIETLDNKPIILYDNANKKLINIYHDLPKDMLNYVTMLDKIVMHASNYTYRKNGECIKEHLQTIIKNINGLEIEDEEKGEFYIDFEFNRYGGEKNQSFDYSSVTISASLDGIELFKIFNPLFRDNKMSKIIPLSYELKLLKTDEFAWGEKE